MLLSVLCFDQFLAILHMAFQFSTHSTKRTEELISVVLRFAGDSGDGIQVTGNQFTNESVLAGNDIATLPNFPAEIRAPAGSLAGVSGFQIHFGSVEINTPGDLPDVLVAFNPAALKANLRDLRPGGILVLNEDTFNEKLLGKVGYTSNPLEDSALRSKYRVYAVPISKLTKEALAHTGLSQREVERSKNFFALGLMLWMYNRPKEHTLTWMKARFAKDENLLQANISALEAGITYADATEMFDVSYVVKQAPVTPGLYRNINGGTALTYGFIAASQIGKLPLFLGAYPITPASELLHELATHKHLDVTTFQAEDEISAICFAIGASYAGRLGITASSGPGISLKTEAMALAVTTELPLVVVNIQRAGPSTGMPTKTEQADLLQACHGRASEAPICVLAASSPSTAFHMAYEACRIATKYMTPVILLSDGFVNTTSEPWKVPDENALRPFEHSFAKTTNNPGGSFLPYLRNEKTLARPWAIPGTPELMHRIGGLEKEDKTGNVCYDADNHHLMCSLRAEKIQRISQEIPKTVIDGAESGDLLCIGWGGTEGAIKEAVRLAREEKLRVSRIHLFHLNPLPPDLEQIMSSFRRVLIPEINFGQLRSLLRDKYLVDAIGFNRVSGQPLKVGDILQAIRETIATKP